MKEILLSLFQGMIVTGGVPKLIEVLDKLHAKDVDQYKAAIFGANALVKAITPLVDGTKTEFDDIFVDALGLAVAQSAATHGIDLTSPTPEA